MTNDRNIDKNQRHSLRDASFHSIVLGAGETYLGAFAIFLHATVLQLGILANLPTLLGAIGQSISVWITQRSKQRRKIVVGAATINAVTLCPIAILPLLPFSDSHKVVALIIFVSLYFISSGVISPAWNSLIGDLIDIDNRSIFFARRTRRAGITLFLSTVSAGLVLDAANRRDLSYVGFAIVFFAAAIARAFSARELSHHDDPAYEATKESKFSFWEFIRRSPWSNFARFVFFFSTIQFGVAISAPYFSLYMLRDLRLSYVEFTTITATAVVAQFLALKNWGYISQTFGNKRILVVCGYGVAINPMLWLFSTEMWFLICVQIFSGVVWSGYNLAAQNFLFDAVSPAKRARCAAYQAIVNGTFVLVGSMVGAFLIPHLNEIPVAIGGRSNHTSSLLYLFLISGVVRLLSSIVFLPLFKEVREVKNSSYPEIIFRVSHIRPISGLAFSMIPLGRKLKDKEIKKIQKTKEK